MNDRFGQIQLVFTFILLIIIAGFVVLLGYKAISNLGSNNCDLEKIQFKEKIVSLLENYDSYDSVHKEELNMPCGYHIVCFVEPNKQPANDPLLNTNQQKIIDTAGQTEQNIFIVGEFAEPAGYSEKIEIEGDDVSLCVEAKGSKALLAFIGQGRTTRVEEWNYGS